MNVTVVFPPSLCLPNQCYYSLPVLTGALKQAGHRPHGVDLNLHAAHRLLTDDRAERMLELAEKAAGVAPDMARKVRDGEECIQILRDPQRYYDQPTFRRAFWTVVDALAFYYQLDPVISPNRDRFVEDMRANQQADAWTPLSDLYDEGLLDPVLEQDPELIGISVAFPEQAVEAIRLARKLKQRNPDIPVCFGGPLLSAHPERWFQSGLLLEYADFAVHGDGERSIVELAEALEGKRDLDDVRGLHYRDARGQLRHPDDPPFLESMDEVPLPDYDSIDMDLFLTPEPVYPMMTARGCYWGRCTFCSLGWRENYRASPESILRRDVEQLVSLGARYVQVQDSSVPPHLARTLARIIEESGHELYWVGGMKFTEAFEDPEYCAQLARGGCRSLAFGFESASQEVLDRMDKGVRFDSIEPILNNLRGQGISAELFWFIGFPTETRTECLDTVRWLAAHDDLYGLPAFVGDYQLHPDTIIFKDPKEFGLTIHGNDNGYYSYTPAAGITQAELGQLKRMLAHTNNRTLVCNGSHVLHVATSGVDLSNVRRPMTIPAGVVEACDA